MGIMSRKGANNDTMNTTSSTTSKGSRILSKLLRFLQLFSATTSLILFSIRLAKVIRLTKRATRSNGAVEGILAAAVLYTIIATLLQICIRSGSQATHNKSHQLMRFMLIIFDILFVAAFIMVAILTSPKRHGSSGPCNSRSAQFIGKTAPSAVNCNLPWGTFILAIFSTVLHAITTLYYGLEEHKAKKNHTMHAKNEDGYGRNGEHMTGDGDNNSAGSLNGVNGARV